MKDERKYKRKLAGDEKELKWGSFISAFILCGVILYVLIAV